MIVLDANILIRAVLGRRVRLLVDTYALRGFRFVTPDVAFVDAETYLPPLLEKRGKPDVDVLQSWIISSRSLNRSILTSTVNLKVRLESVCAVAMRMTGRCWQPHWDLIATFGAKTKTFSGRESRSGRPAGSRSSSNHSRGKRNAKKSKPLCSCGVWNQSFLARVQIPGFGMIYVQGKSALTGASETGTSQKPLARPLGIESGPCLHPRPSESP